MMRSAKNWTPKLTLQIWVLQLPLGTLGPGLPPQGLIETGSKNVPKKSKFRLTLFSRSLRYQKLPRNAKNLAEFFLGFAGLARYFFQHTEDVVRGHSRRLSRASSNVLDTMCLRSSNLRHIFDHETERRSTNILSCFHFPLLPMPFVRNSSKSSKITKSLVLMTCVCNSPLLFKSATFHRNPKS